MICNSYCKKNALLENCISRKTKTFFFLKGKQNKNKKLNKKRK